LQRQGRLGVVRKEEHSVKDLSWQSMALGGAIVVALSAAIPGSHGGGSASPPPVRAAGFEVEVYDDGVVGAVLTLDPDAVVEELSISSPDVVFGDPAQVEPGVWVVEAAAHLAGGCYTVTAEVVLGGAANEPHSKAKKSQKSGTSKKKSHDKTKAAGGRGDGHGDSDSDSDHGDSDSDHGSKPEPGGAPLVLTLTATGCDACVPGAPQDDPFTPLPDRS
jgi:hypothetical protein